MNIQLKGYNDAPEGKDLEEYMRDNHFFEYLEVADAKRRFWQNDDATLVVRIKDPNERLGLTFDQGVKLGELVWEHGADEFDRIVEDYRTYYRIWWD